MKRLSLALAALLAVGGAQAATVSFQYGQPIVESTTEINQTGQLGLFDSSLGALTGVSLTIFGSATFQFTGTNTASGPQQANLVSSTALVWSSSIGGLSALLTDTIALQLASGFQTYAVGETKSFGPVQQSGRFTFDLTCESFSGFAAQGGGATSAARRTRKPVAAP